VSQQDKIHMQEDEIYRLRNNLKWISQLAFMHYFGGAFEPEHMRSISNLCVDALNGKEIRDFDECMEESQMRARELANKMHAHTDENFNMADDEDDEYVQFVQ
jgi:hypothetical protein